MLDWLRNEFPNGLDIPLARLALRQGQTSSPVLASGLGLWRLEEFLYVLGCVVELVLP